jgi:hypothetical protein
MIDDDFGGEAGFEGLTDEQHKSGRLINRRARDGWENGNRLTLIREADLPADHKAALAEIWGGPGAGEEFRR